MNELLLAVVNFGALGLVQWIIIAIVIAGIIGVAMVVAKQAGIVIPGFIVTIGWIVLCVFIWVIAIKFLAQLM